MSNFKAGLQGCYSFMQHVIYESKIFQMHAVCIYNMMPEINCVNKLGVSLYRELSWEQKGNHYLGEVVNLKQAWMKVIGTQ